LVSDDNTRQETINIIRSSIGRTEIAPAEKRRQQQSRVAEFNITEENIWRE